MSGIDFLVVTLCPNIRYSMNVGRHAASRAEPIFRAYARFVPSPLLGMADETALVYLPARPNHCCLLFAAKTPSWYLAAMGAR
jgi:hypothetical protein